MQTIGRNTFASQDARRGDFSAMCDVCGVMWPRSQMRRTQGGALRCPDDVAGRDEFDLAQASAAAVRDSRPLRPRMDGGAGYDSTTNGTASVDVTDGGDIYL